MYQFDQFIDLLKILIRCPSVVGAEHSFFRVLQRELEERGASVKWYEGLLVAQGSKPHQTMFSAHIDRHGLICTGPNEFQYAAFVAGNRSDLLGNSVSEKLMLKVADRFNQLPVVAYDPWSGTYRGRGIIKKTFICEYRNNLIFELLGLDHLVAGTPVAFDDKLKMTDLNFMGQLDNVLTTAMLVHLFDLGFEGTLFFTAGEEAGRSWRYLLEWFRRYGQSTDQLIVVDTSPYASLEEVAFQDIVLRKKDANASFNEKTTFNLEHLCRDLKVSFSYKDQYIAQLNQDLMARGEEPLPIGSTEMGRLILASRGLVQGTTLQIPTTGYHTMSETVFINACKTFIQVLQNIAQHLNEY